MTSTRLTCGKSGRLKLALVGVLFLLYCLVLASFSPMVLAEETSQFFPETGNTVSGKFLEYWQANGGLATYGYPITDAKDEVDPETGKTFLTQWFERSRFELHPENAGTKYEVLLGLVGKDLKREALDVDPDFAPTEAILDPAYPKELQLYFSQTSHNVKPRFASFWQKNGGLDRFGFPISEEHEELDPETGHFYKVQWFERARLEYHPENQPPYEVMVGLVGKQLKQPNPGSVELMWKMGGNDQALENMAVNRLGNIYVVDMANSIRYYNPQGQLLGSWGVTGTGPGQFDGPSGIAFDREDNVYIADSHNQRIQKFDREGGFIMEWGGNSQSAPGKDSQPEPGTFLYPSGIAFDSHDNIYVTDSGNNRVQKFDKQGHFLLSWGSEGTADGQFIGPEGLVIDSQDNVFVSDFGSPTGKGKIVKDPFIQKFDGQGRFLLKWTPLNEGNKALAAPLKLAIDRQDNLFVLSGGDKAVQKYDNRGNFLLKWSAPGRSIATTPDGQIYLALADENTSAAANLTPTINRYEQTGQLQGELKLKSKFGANYFNVVRDIALDRQGNFYVLNSSSGLIRKFNPAGHFLMEWRSGSGPEKAGEFRFLSSLTVDSAGNVYVAEFGNHHIFKYDNQGKLLLEWPVVVGNEAHSGEPWHISVDSQGNLYAAISEILNSQGASQPKIIKYDSQGHLLARWGSVGTGAGQFEQLIAIAADQDGNVFVSDSLEPGGSLRGRLQKFDSQGNFLQQWQGGDGKDQGGDIRAPTDITFDNQGRIFVSDSGLNKIEVFDRQGVYQGSIGGTGRGDGQLLMPSSLTLDSNGNLFVVDSGNGRLQKFRLR